MNRHPRPEPSPTTRYTMAVTGVVVATAVRLALDPVLGTQSPYLPFVLAILLAARFGGRAPGFAATVLSAVSVAWFFVAPGSSLNVPATSGVWGLGLFVATGSWISLSVGSLRLAFHTAVQAQQQARRASEQRDLAVKQAGEEMQRVNAELERHVCERTAQLEAANRELESFSYSVSHDLRAPLRGIDGWSLALAEDYAGKLDVQAKEYLQRIRSETQRMGILIGDLLQLSRIGRAQMDQRAVDLSSEADRVAVRLREAHPQRQMEFVIEPGLTGTGDARLLEVALTNLLGNAVKFTGPRSQARIEFGHSGNDGERAFYVRDNGVGFDMAFAGTLFGAFQRLHGPSEFPGSGIGLATVQRIIHRHGGRVWAESQPDQGATFYFTLGGK